MKKIKVTTGVYWIGVPEADVYLLCGCPADATKHLIKKGSYYFKRRRFRIQLRNWSQCYSIVRCTDSKRAFLRNMSEFPVLQMLYRQGMLIPNHPRNNE